MALSTGRALRLLWRDRVTVVTYTKAQQPSGLTKFEERTVLEGEPCKLSFASVRSVSPTDGEALVVQTTKLFLDKGVGIPPGSKIIVTRDGKDYVFGCSGEPGRYSSHQEIVLEPYVEYA